MKTASPFSPEQDEFIRRNWRTLSARRMAAELGLKRKDVEDLVRALASQERKEVSPLLPGREWVWLAVVLFAGFLLRLYYLQVLSGTPFFSPLSKLLDDGVFDARGLSIAAGDLLGRDWSWLIYNTPLYPYLLGAAYFLFGHSIGTVHLLQTSLGALTPLLVYLLTKEAFGRGRAPLLAAVMSGAYVPFIYYENLLVGESVALFLTLCALLLLARALNRDDRSLGTAFGAGLLFGVAALLRPHLLVAVVFPALYLGWRWGFKARSPRGAVAAGLLLAGVAAGISPITLKNYFLYKEFIPVSAIGGINLYMSNNPKVERGMAPTTIFGYGLKEIPDQAAAIAEKAEGRPLSPTELSNYWKARTFDYVRGAPAGFTRLMLRKTAYFFNRYEFADMRDLLFTAEFIPLLKTSRWQYGAVAALALCGVLLGLAAAGPAAGLLFLFAFGYAGSVVLFYVTSRYRILVVPVFIVFAAGALDRIWSAWAARDRRFLARAALFGALCSALVFYPLREMNFSRSYNSLGIYFDEKGRYADSERSYLKAVQLDPYFTAPYHNLALHYHFRAGDEPKAQAFEKRFRALQEYERAHGAQESGL